MTHAYFIDLDIQKNAADNGQNKTKYAYDQGDFLQQVGLIFHMGILVRMLRRILSGLGLPRDNNAR